MLELRDITMEFRIPGRKEPFQAVKNANISLGKGEIHGIVGESGSGKSTLAKVAIRLLEPSGGGVHWNGVDVTHLKERDLRPLRRQIQMVFQDPFSSLNPRQKVESILREPLKIHKEGTNGEQLKRATEMLERVGLGTEDLAKYPHEFSGGQRQRICIARALMLKPEIIIADEAISALDVSIQTQILALMMELRKDFDLSYLFITHDLEVVRLISDTVSVMEHGVIVEQGNCEAIFEQTQHPYTKRLLASRPSQMLESEPKSTTP